MFKSIKARMMTVIAVTVLVLIGAASWLSYRSSEATLQTALFNEARNSAGYNAQIIKNWLGAIKTEITTLSETPALQSMIWEEQSGLLASSLEGREDYQLMFVADRSGQMQTTNGQMANISDRNYFQQSLQQNKVVFSKPFVGVTGEYTVAVVAPIVPAGQARPVGVVGADIDIAYMQELVKEMKIGEYGNGFIVDADMNTIAHPDDKYIGNQDIYAGNSKFKEIATLMAKGESGMDFYSLNGVDKMLAYAPIGEAGWSLAIGANMGDVMAPVYKSRNSTILIAVIAVFLGLIVAYFIAHFIAAPIKLVQKASEALAEGDLTRTVTYNAKDEIGQMAQALNRGMEHLRNLVIQVANSSEQVGASSEELASAAQEVGQASQQVADTISQLAKGANEQAVATQETAKVIENMSAAIKKVGTAAQKMVEDANSTREAADEGQQLVDQAVHQMTTIRDTVDESATAVKGLGERSQQIGNIVEVITGIADQTNLLALNAAIEAARAGEQGRGFAVVAEEVRKLAEQSRTAAEQISSLIKEIQDETTKAVSKMESGNKEVAAGVEVVAKTGKAFEAIDRTVKVVVAQIKTVNAAAEELSAGSDQVVNSVESIASIGEEAAAGTEEVSASSQQQNASVEEIVASSEALAEMAQEMQRAVSSFRVK